MFSTKVPDRDKYLPVYLGEYDTVLNCLYANCEPWT